MARYASTANDLASREVAGRPRTMEDHEGRGVGPNKGHRSTAMAKHLPGISETARIFAGVGVFNEPASELPRVHYNRGVIPADGYGVALELNCPFVERFTVDVIIIAGRCSRCIAMCAN